METVEGNGKVAVSAQFLEELLAALRAAGDGEHDVRMSTRRSGTAKDIARSFNALLDSTTRFNRETTRVARAINRDGRTTERFDMGEVHGGWATRVDAINSLIDALARPTNEAARVISAVAEGDLTQKMPLSIDGRPVKGEFARIGSVVNSMVDLLSAFSAEVTRVAREVGTEGRLGGQAQVKGVSGTWKDLTDNVNQLAGNLTSQVRNIAQVTTAVAEGDLSQKITVDARGEVAELKDTVNTMVDQLGSFADEVTRVAREVGTEGRLGGQAQVKGVSGTWKDLTDNVNQLAGNLTGQVRNIAQVTTAVARGDLSQKITVEAHGEVAELKDTVNTMVDQLGSFADEVTRVAREVGTEGMLGGQAQVRGVAGTWKDLTDNVNQLAGNLTGQVRNIAQVTTAVAGGDLSQKITVQAHGEVAELKHTINTMVDQLSAFAGEVTRVAREVGTDGKLGGQAVVPGVSGTWKDLTDNVNSMADNLTDQVRNIAQVTTAVAQGDLSQKITVDARGEILQLKTTVNKMVDQLSAFASEVTRVAREVGTEGKLGGQAEVQDVSGTWARLTENVNQLAGNLTTQVRSIAEVATAVAQGDLTRTITVDAAGEVRDLKDNINQMISNLRETTRLNEEQDWLKSNLARIGAMLQGHRDLRTVSQLIMSELTPLVGAQHGAFYMSHPPAEEPVYRLLAGYGYKARKGVPVAYGLGEGLVGQAALERRTIVVDNVPPTALRISTGLGEGTPVSIIVLPVLFEEQCLAVIELASFRPLSAINQAFLEQIVETVGVVLNTIIATMRTEELLEQSQSLATELQARQDELQHTNAELEEKALELARQNRAIEVKNAEIELARRELEERAEQLALSSKYKSEFLANMSHELRTPLNSLLILAKLLADNSEGNLTDKQVEFASSIRAAGHDLLNLISDILDLSKVEAGKLDVAIAPVSIEDMCADLKQTFEPIADNRADLAFCVELADDLPAMLTTDGHRVQQVLKNLLSNAFKFTQEGSVTLRVERSPAGQRYFNPRLDDHREVVAFSVVDTGIGIPSDKLVVIFEAFQQVEGTTNRKYGGTGLGLSISREIAALLGGEIQVVSEAGRGSTFTLLLPVLPHSERRDRPTPAPTETSPEPGLLDRGNEGEESALEGVRILIVDDDVRNVYALTSALEDRGAKVLTAENGRAGVELLSKLSRGGRTRAEEVIDIVLMDIMMPEMDGYETTKAIRNLPGFKDLPIIALTAKAMRGDREKSLAAGASDYITKPVEIGQLLSLMHLWLER